MADKKGANPQYEVSISFAGENRQVAEQIAKLLRSRRIKVFYDYYEQSDLLGKNLIDVFSNIYAHDSRYCLMIISEHYIKKLWTNVERQIALARVFEGHQDHIIPVRLDSTRVSGIPSTIGYYDLRKGSIEKLVDLVVQKVRNQGSRTSKSKTSTTSKTGTSRRPRVIIPKIKKVFSQQEKGAYLVNTLAEIKRYFRQGLSELEKRSDITTSYEAAGTSAFVCKVYLRGDLKNQCRISIGSAYTKNSIIYAEGRSIEFSGGQHINDSITLDDDGFQMYLRSSFPIYLRNYSEQGEVQLTQRKTAERLWLRFCEPLTR